MSAVAPAPFVVRQSKVCSQCGEEKPLSDYYLREGRPRASCKPCWCAQSREHQKANPERARERQRTSRAKQERWVRTLRERWRLTPEDYEQMLADQDGVCAICGKEQGAIRFHIDHDHSSGLIRQLLCGLCNRMLGQGLDDPDILQAGAEYLRRHRASHG